MEAAQIEAPAALHKFEVAGLGAAPFKFVGTYEAKFQSVPGAPVQPGTSCDFCLTSIMYVCVIEGADGKRFKVGCDCVLKTGDAGLVRRVKAVQSKAAKVKRVAKKTAELAAVPSKVAAVLAATEGLELALAGEHHITRSIASRFQATGKISAAQIALVFKLAGES